MCWNSPRMRMKMHWRVVGRRHSRRFAIAAGDAACRMRTFFVVFGWSVTGAGDCLVQIDGHTTVRRGATTTSEPLAMGGGWSEPAGLRSQGSDTQAQRNKERSETHRGRAEQGRKVGWDERNVARCDVLFNLESFPGISLQTPARSAHKRKSKDHKMRVQRCKELNLRNDVFILPKS